MAISRGEFWQQSEVLCSGDLRQQKTVNVVVVLRKELCLWRPSVDRVHSQEAVAFIIWMFCFLFVQMCAALVLWELLLVSWSGTGAASTNFVECDRNKSALAEWIWGTFMRWEFSIEMYATQLSQRRRTQNEYSVSLSIRNAPQITRCQSCIAQVKPANVLLSRTTVKAIPCVPQDNF